MRDIYRLLPCPNIAAVMNFRSINLEPPALEGIFVTLAIGPHLLDLHALACFGIPKDAKDAPGQIEVIQSFAISDPAYIAICEGARSLLEPLGFECFLGTINMLSTLAPIRITEIKPFYMPLILSPEDGRSN